MATAKAVASAWFVGARALRGLPQTTSQSGRVAPYKTRTICPEGAGCGVVSFSPIQLQRMQLIIPLFFPVFSPIALSPQPGTLKLKSFNKLLRR